MNFVMRKLLPLLLLVIFVIIFAHSEMGPAKAESMEIHLHHDYCHLVDHTLPASSIVIKWSPVVNPVYLALEELENTPTNLIADSIVLIRHQKLLIHNSSLLVFSTLLI